MNKGPIKTYVLDTTVLIYDPDIMFKTGEADWVIPLAVIREIDGLKNSDKDLVAKAARQIARTLDRFGSYGDLSAGVKLPTGRILRIIEGFEKIDALASDADNKILGAALLLKNAGENVTLFTVDANMRTVARVYGIKAEYSPFFDIELPQGASESIDAGDRQASVNDSYPWHISQVGRGKFRLSAGSRRVSGVLMKLCFVVVILGFAALFFTPKAYYDSVSMVTGFALLGGIALMVYRAYAQLGFSKRPHDPNLDIAGSAAFSWLPGNAWHEKDDS